MDLATSRDGRTRKRGSQDVESINLFVKSPFQLGYTGLLADIDFAKFGASSSYCTAHLAQKLLRFHERCQVGGNRICAGFVANQQANSAL